MPPQTKDGYPSVTNNPAGVTVTSSIHVYPAKRDHILKTPEIWLRGKKEDDNVYPYWRIYDKLYDFSDFINTHPGGKFWLEETRGMDITESFESSHFSNLPEKMLQKYFIKNTNAPRTTSFTFNEDGFYKTLKRKAVKILKENGGTAPTNEMKFVLDSLVVAFFVFMFLAAIYSNYYFAVISGISLACAGTAAHNFFHLRDNWRMYAFDLGIMSSRDWRISHALSHHIFPNTIYDFEASGVEPLFQFFPSNKKSLLYFITLIPKIVIFMPIDFHLEFIKNIMLMFIGKRKIMFPDFFPIFQLIAMIWFVIHMIGNFIIHFFGLQAAHHHSHIFHEGDRYPNDKDWGLLQRRSIFPRSPFPNSRILRKSHITSLVSNLLPFEALPSTGCFPGYMQRIWDQF
ncbi:Cytochrome b5-related protein [Armadillidium nasatum]|uniref:Cytochrome b5-related protein n=1 Tax=Armadillidium nasatum TaxID=96803 RepID=A0A5N5TG85_9CRUS|nr:Cytochrome b5-related protein [Armadillidium nasatum]